MSPECECDHDDVVDDDGDRWGGNDDGGIRADGGGDDDDAGGGGPTANADATNDLDGGADGDGETIANVIIETARRTTTTMASNARAGDRLRRVGTTRVGVVVLPRGPSSSIS